ncbi:DNA replication protein DnaC [Spirochaetia bacterium]|nr:DNA replication protein DnaC [Spirochaetia bacterium]
MSEDKIKPKPIGETLKPFVQRIKERQEEAEREAAEEKARFDALPEAEKAKILAEQEKERLAYEAMVAAEERRILEEKWRSRGITPRYLGEYWDTWKADTPDKKRAIEQVKKAWNKNLLLAGKNGTGKTHLAMSLVKDGAVYRTASGIFRSIRMKFDDEDGIIKNLGQVKLLIIDEIGRTNNTPFEKGVLFEIIDLRWQNRLPTMLITNMEINVFSEEYGTGIIDRLRPVVVRFDWKSMRGNENNG